MNKALLLWINHAWANPWLDGFFTWVSQKDTFAFPLLAVILMLCGTRFGTDGVKLWVLLLCVIGIADASGNAIKHLTHEPRPCFDIAAQVRTPGFAKPRPCGANLDAMPSNHAMNFFAAALFLSFIVRLPWAQVTLVLIAVAVGLSRIYMGKHYPSQVAAGMVLGGVWGLVAAWTSVKYVSFVQRIRTRFR